MTPEQIREIVIMTLDELGGLDAHKLRYRHILLQTEKELRKYFSGKSAGMRKALIELSDDAYIDIIYLQYRDGMTLEWIAAAMGKDISTIKRNKRRLIYKIHRFIE